MAIEVIDFTKIGQDERGTTASFKVKDDGDFIYLTRKKGTVSGNTYHEGKNKGTNPKVFILLNGEIELAYRNHEEEQVYKEHITAPKVIKVAPFTIHKITALTDMLILENNSIDDIAADRIRENVEKIEACEETA